MKKKSLESAILELRSRGYKIQYRRRSDGGVIVTKIGGQSFTGADGNRVVREMTGVVLSEAQERQRQVNVKEYIAGHKKPKETITDQIRRETKRAQALWRKRGLEAKGKGKIRMSTIRKRLKYRGAEETLASLKNIQRYAMGYAYAENVTLLANRIDALGKLESDEKTLELIAKVRNRILEMVDEFPEDLIEPINNIAYDKSKSVKQRISEIATMLHVS